MPADNESVQVRRPIHRPSQTLGPMILTLANPSEGEIRFPRASINF